MTSTSDDTLPSVGTIERTDGNVMFRLPCMDGMGVIPFPEMMRVGVAERYQAIKNIELRKSDILLVSHPKSGTHWTKEIIHMLLNGTADYRGESTLDTLEQRIDLAELDTEESDSPRILNTHFPYRWLPRNHVKNGGKIVYTMRNPKDTYVSLYHFLKFYEEIGTNIPDMTWEQFFNNLVVSEVPLLGGWWTHVKEMAIAGQGKYGSLIHTVTYEKLKMEPVNEIEKLARFLDVSYTKQLLSDIADKCSFDKMKTVQRPYSKNKVHEAMRNIPEGEDFERIRTLYRKGVIGDWKNTFTVAQNELFDDIYRKQLEGITLDLMYDSNF